MPSRGVRVRDYEVWGRLGEGGMSEVWLAKHAVLCVPVVLKTLRPGIDEGELHFDRMLAEARMMARIAAPQVVRAIDAGVHDGVGYVVQEYVDGIDLAELDGSRRRSLGLGLPLWFVCTVMSEACRALQASHRAGILHRDVKPSNMFFSAHTGVRLGDFGIAVSYKEARRSSEVTGTFRFMSPEQLRGDPCDRRSDVWGAGATAFDLRYGRPPFEDLRSMIDAAAEPSFGRAATASEAYFQHVLRAMLVKDVDRRASDLGDLARHFSALARAQEPPPDRSALVKISRHRYRLGSCVIELRTGDIASARADGIVSSAHDHMRMRSGVGDALRQRGGDSIEEEAIRAGEQPLGSCIATSAGSLDARRVLHAVSAWNEVSCVGRASQRAFLLADELGLRSLAIPALGTGASRVTMENCASALATALRAHVLLGGTRLRSVEFFLRDEATLDTFVEVAEDALRGDGVAPIPDLGLEVEGLEVKADAVTYVHPSRS